MLIYLLFKNIKRKNNYEIDNFYVLKINNSIFI